MIVCFFHRSISFPSLSNIIHAILNSNRLEPKKKKQARNRTASLLFLNDYFNTAPVLADVTSLAYLAR